MKIAALAYRNVLRNRFRTVLTTLGVAVAILAFVMLRTVVSSWTAAIDYASKDRIVTRHKISFIMSLPRKYVQEISDMPEIKDAALAVWFGAKDPKHEHEFFSTIAVEPEPFLKVYDEIVAPQDQKENWFQNRRGALVGDVLAKKLGWKVGDRVTLRGTIYPGDWEFEISGIYTATRKSVDRSSFWFHYDYMNDAVPLRLKDRVGWVVSRVKDPSRATEVSLAVDRHFDERELQTLSMNELAFQQSFLGMMSTILKAIDIVSAVILLIMVLILGNTIAMGVRERTQEYGVLRAIGFVPKHLVMFIVGEAIATGLLGGVVGLALAIPFVNLGIGRFLEENMGAWFPFFRVPMTTAAAALVLAGLLGVAAAVVPAYRASRLNVIDALRRVG
ncbi:MAG TPA: FtsX-like permease family protein [Polyangiaceae bacterium]|nr:FtsX-like permease family protein [Polyangiaceae bacterium]